MKVLTFSRQFPKGHPKVGEPTYFVEKIWNCFRKEDFSLPDRFNKWIQNFIWQSPDEYLKIISLQDKKHHTIRAGSRFNSGDMVSLRVWSDKPYRSKQIEFAQVEVKKVWDISIHIVGKELLWQLPGVGSGVFESLSEGLKIIARNDGLGVQDFIDWFTIHPKKKEQKFTGQIIAWDDSINY